MVRLGQNEAEGCGKPPILGIRSANLRFAVCHRDETSGLWSKSQGLIWERFIPGRYKSSRTKYWKRVGGIDYVQCWLWQLLWLRFNKSGTVWRTSNESR